MESICVMFSLVVIGYLGSAKTNWRWDFLWFDNDAYRLTEEMVMADDWIVVLLRFMQLLKKPIQATDVFFLLLLQSLYSCPMRTTKWNWLKRMWCFLDQAKRPF